jgi:ligand-binding sensor domain-containing protein/serine phosphatase RsbU (regulator of sigma subunit)
MPNFIFSKLKTDIQQKISIVLICFIPWVAQVQAQRNLRALDPHKKLTQYIIDHWTTDHGLPANNIRRILQTQDGYLWMVGFGGLVNFDGVRFGVFNRKNTELFKTNSVFNLSEGSDGTLWIGSEGSGLLSYKNGIFKRIGLEHIFITALYAETPRRLWVSGRNAGVYQFDPQKNIFQLIEYPALNKVSVYCVRKSTEGELWFGTDGKGLVRMKDNQFKTYTTQDGLPTNSIIELFFDRNKKLWVATTEGLAYQEGDKFKTIPQLSKNIVYKIIEDESGSLWIATSSGLCRRNILTGEFEFLPQKQEDAITNVQDLWLDPEGSLWIGTYRSGLFRLKDGKFTNFTYEDGLATASVGSVCEVDKDKYLVGMNNGKINLIENGQIKKFPLKTPLPEIRIFHILKDSKQQVWVCTFDGLVKINPDGSEVLYTKEKGLPDNTIRVAFEDKQGNIWLGTRWGGVVKIDSQGKMTRFNTTNGLSSNFIMSIKQDLDGNILIGTNDKGLNIIQSNGKIDIWDTAKGLLSNLVFSTYIDKQGVVWMTGNSGISRLEKSKLTNYSSKEGLLNESPFDFVEDKFGNVWLPTSEGIVKVSKKDLNLYAQGKVKAEQILWMQYDKHDGMKSEDCTGAAHSLITADGKVLVPTNGGLVAIDPLNMPMNHLKPRIRINSLRTDTTWMDIHKIIMIQPSNKRLVFDYSALSLLASAKVRFKYKLEGFDAEWQDAGNNRQATYTNLPAGEYTFRVIACNNDGVWNTVGSSLKFSRIPHFYETYWFPVLLGMVFWLVISGIFRWRIYAIQQRKKILEYQVELKTAEVKAQNTELSRQRDEINQQKRLLEKRNDNIINSLNYAKRIQQAMLPSQDEIQSVLPESFVLFQPKDIVSGDFYWITSLHSKPIYEESTSPNRSNLAFQGFTHPKIVIGAIDCTGHGVPGAFMSMIGNDLLNEIINLRGITSPDRILSELHLSIIKTLKQQDTANRDGMDMVLCVIDQTTKTLEFAGAKNPVYYIQDDELHELKGDKLPIGGYYKEYERFRMFTKHIVPLDKPSHFYLFSDGFQDQFGEMSRKKFSRQRIRELIKENYRKPMSEQKNLFHQTILDWSGNEEQVDDILVIGFKLDWANFYEPAL